MNPCQLHLYTAILLRLGARGVRLAEVLARHAPESKRRWLLENDGEHPRPMDRLHYAIRLLPREILRAFVLKIEIRGNNECWEWTDHCNPYGQFYVSRGVVRSHVLMKSLWDGLPETYGGRSSGSNAVRHTCDNPKCCNPTHLLNGTIQDNAKDAFKRGRSSIRFVIPVARDRWNKGMAQRDPKTGRIVRWAREHALDFILPHMCAADPNQPEHLQP